MPYLCKVKPRVGEIRRYAVYWTENDGPCTTPWIGYAIKSADGLWHGVTYDGHYRGIFTTRREVVELLFNRAKVHGLVKEKIG